MSADPPADWILSQKKVFTNWVNLYLGKRDLQVKDLQTDFSDGVLLCNLMEIISGKKLPTRWKTEAKTRLLRVQNLNIALQFIADEGIKLVACGSEDICDNNLKLIMGMIWTLILRYQIQTGNLMDKDSKKMGAKEALLTWAQQNTSSYSDIPVKDFHVSWQDGRAFCALVHRLAPDHIDMSKLNPDDKLANLNLAFDVANKVLGVPKLLDANDIAGSSKPDEQSIMTYVSLFPQLYADRGITLDGSGSNESKNKQEDDEKKKKEEEERKKREEERKKQEEERKKKEKEDAESKRTLMVKARSHGEVNKISDLEDKLRQLEIQVAKLTNENGKLSTENANLRTDLLAKEKKIDDLEKENSRESEKIRELDEKWRKAEEKVRESDEMLKQLEEEVREQERVKERAEGMKQLEEEYIKVKGSEGEKAKELMKRVVEAEVRKREEEKKGEKWRVENEENKKRLVEADRKAREREESYRKEEEKERKALEKDFSNKLEELEKAIRRLEGEKSQLEKRNGERGERIRGLVSDNEGKQRKVEELEGRLREYERGGKGNQNGDAELREKLRKFEEEENKSQAKRMEEISKLEEENRKQAEKVAALEESLRKKGGDEGERIKELEEKLRLAEERITKESERVKELEDEVKREREEKEKVKEENERLKKELESKSQAGDANEATLIQELEQKLKDKTQEHETEKSNREALEAQLSETEKKREEERQEVEKEREARQKAEKRAEQYQQQLEDLIKQTDGLRSNTESIVTHLEHGLEDDKIKLKALEDQLEKAARDAAQAQKVNEEIEEKLKQESETCANVQRELDELKAASSEDEKKMKELEERVAELENALKEGDNGVAQELEKKNAKIKELEELLKKSESERKRDSDAFRAKSDAQTKDLRLALEQVQSFYDMVSTQGDALTTARMELHHLEQELTFSHHSNSELIHEVKQLARTIAALKAKFLHSFSNLPIAEYSQFCSALFASHSKVSVTFSVQKSTLSLSSGSCQFFDENAKVITKHQDHTKFTSKNELQIDFAMVPEEVNCILVILTLEGGVLVGGESVKGEVEVDFKKEHTDKIDLNIALNKHAALEKFENSANVPKRLIAIMFSRCEEDENTLWGTVKRFNISEGVWRVGTVGLFDCEKPAANYGLLHKLVPIKRYGWAAYADIHDIYSLIAHLDNTLNLNTKELSRMNQEIGSLYSVQKELEKKLEIALIQKCTHGEQKFSNETLIKYKFLTNSQFSFFGLFLLDVIMQQTSIALSRHLGPANPADPTHSPRTVRNNTTQLRNNVQAELAQIAETEATFKGLMTSSSTAAAEYAQSDERDALAAQISRVTAALENLVSQLERDKAIGYAMKSSVQLQQYLGAEAEKLVSDSENKEKSGLEDSANGSPGTGTGTGKGKKKHVFVPTKEDIYPLLEEFRTMEYVENEDTIPQDMPQNNSTLLVVHAVHHAAQQALFSGKICKSILSLQQGLSPDSELYDQIRKEADRRYADMQGWVGEWVSNLGKLAGLVTARTGTLVSTYIQFQKDYESLRKQHQQIKDKLDFLGNEQKVDEAEPEEKVVPIPVISLDIAEEEPKKAPPTPPLSKKPAPAKGPPSPMSRKNAPAAPTAKTPPLTRPPKEPSSPAHYAKTLPLKSPSKLTARQGKDKKGEKGDKGEKVEKSEKNEKSEKPERKTTPASPAKSAPPPPKSAAAAVEVDKQLAEILDKLQVTGPISKIGDCQYQIGTKKVTMQIISGYLVVRVGGGFMKFEEWILRFGRKEGLMIAGEAISATGAMTLTGHGGVSMKAMPHKENQVAIPNFWGGCTGSEINSPRKKQMRSGTL